jgi:hypothetical protein
MRPMVPVVFAGLSLALAEVRGSLHADVYAPVAAGDLGGLEPRATVAIIDGSLRSRHLLSKEEISRALPRGIAVDGVGSVGALCALEQGVRHARNGLGV